MNKLKQNKLLPKGLVAMVVFFLVGVLTTGLVYADLVDDAQQGVNANGGGTTSSDVPTLLQTITSGLLFLVGAVAVIMIIVGGFRFVISQGDSQAAANARNTVIYSVVGLVVAVLAYAIVSFALTRIFDSPGSSNNTPGLNLPPTCDTPPC